MRTCITPGHGDKAARLYSGGWLCDSCAENAAAARNGTSRPRAQVRLAIVGTRVLACAGDRDRARARAEAAIKRLVPDVVISGGAEGADTLAGEAAIRAGYSEETGTLVIFRPRVRRFHGPGGFRERDEQIAQDCTHLLRIACGTATTYGSGWTADRAEELGAVVVRYDACNDRDRIPAGS
jgi:hypothetical protein